MQVQSYKTESFDELFNASEAGGDINLNAVITTTDGVTTRAYVGKHEDNPFLPLGRPIRHIMSTANHDYRIVVMSTLEGMATITEMPGGEVVRYAIPANINRLLSDKVIEDTLERKFSPTFMDEISDIVNKTFKDRVRLYPLAFSQKKGNCAYKAYEPVNGLMEGLTLQRGKHTNVGIESFSTGTYNVVLAYYEGGLYIENFDQLIAFSKQWQLGLHDPLEFKKALDLKDPFANEEHMWPICTLRHESKSDPMYIFEHWLRTFAKNDKLNGLLGETIRAITLAQTAVIYGDCRWIDINDEVIVMD